MPDVTGYRGGVWNAQCDMCGLVFKSDKLTKAWDGSMRCRECFETRHPQDFVRSITEELSPPWTRDWLPQFTAQAKSSVTAAANIVLPSTAVPDFTITGAATINQISPNANGRLVLLTFDTNGVIINNSGNLVLVGETSHTFKAWDNIAFQCIGSTWKESYRFLAP